MEDGSNSENSVFSDNEDEIIEHEVLDEDDDDEILGIMADEMWRDESEVEAVMWQELRHGRVLEIERDMRIINMFHGLDDRVNDTVVNNMERVLPEFLEKVLKSNVQVFLMRFIRTTPQIISLIEQFIRKSRNLKTLGLQHIMFNTTYLTQIMSALRESNIKKLFLSEYYFDENGHTTISFRPEFVKLDELKLETNFDMEVTESFCNWIRGFQLNKITALNYVNAMLFNTIMTHPSEVVATFDDMRIKRSWVAAFFGPSFNEQTATVVDIHMKSCQLKSDTLKLLIENLPRIPNFCTLTMEQTEIPTTNHSWTRADSLSDDVFDLAEQVMLTKGVVIGIDLSPNHPRYATFKALARRNDMLLRTPINADIARLYPTVIVGTNAFARSAVCNVLRNTPRETRWEDERLLFIHDGVEDITGYEFAMCDNMVRLQLLHQTEDTLYKKDTAAGAPEILRFFDVGTSGVPDVPEQVLPTRLIVPMPKHAGSVRVIEDDDMFPNPLTTVVTAIDLFPETFDNNAVAAKNKSIALMKKVYGRSRNLIVFVCTFSMMNGSEVLRQQEYCRLAGVDVRNTELICYGIHDTERVARTRVLLQCWTPIMFTTSMCLFASTLHREVLQNRRLTMTLADVHEISARCGFPFDTYSDAHGKNNQFMDYLKYFMDVQYFASTENEIIYVFDRNKFNRVLHNAVYTWLNNLPPAQRRAYLSNEDDNELIKDPLLFDCVWQGAMGHIHSTIVHAEDSYNLSKIVLDNNMKQIFWDEIHKRRCRYHI